MRGPGLERRGCCCGFVRIFRERGREHPGEKLRQINDMRRRDHEDARGQSVLSRVVAGFVAVFVVTSGDAAPDLI